MPRRKDGCVGLGKSVEVSKGRWLVSRSHLKKHFAEQAKGTSF